MYIEREITGTLKRLASSFPIILVTGARQVGKSTLLEHVTAIDRITFDDTMRLSDAKEDAKTFLHMAGTPVIFDEVQKASFLFPFLKQAADEGKRSGMYLLTGSQQFQLMRHVSESLSGRVGILNLPPLSLREVRGMKGQIPFIPTQEYILSRKHIAGCKPDEIWTHIQHGLYPSVVTGKQRYDDFYASYVSSYLERDVRNLTQVGDLLQFQKFMQVAAARTGQLVNYRNMAQNVGISEPTAKTWLSILVSSGLVFLLPAYSKNVTKRIVKTPKLYFMDTGLACYLTRWTSPEVLEKGAMAGAMFETFVISELRKSWMNAGKEPPFSFYRDTDQHEVDLLIEDNGRLFPVEIKKTALLNGNEAQGFRFLAQGITGFAVAPGTIICNAETIGIPSKGVFALPVSSI